MGVQGKSEGMNAFSFSLESRDERGRHSWSGEHYLVLLAEKDRPDSAYGGRCSSGMAGSTQPSEDPPSGTSVSLLPPCQPLIHPSRPAQICPPL